mgnify:CR=1 FL=1
MPCYAFFCDDCEVSWEKLRPISEADKGSKCPECRNKGQRDYNFGIMKFDLMSRASQHKNRDFYEGGDKKLGRKVLENLGTASEKRMKQQASAYSVMRPNMKYFEGKGKARRLTQAQSTRKRKNLEKMTRHVYNKAKMDPSKPNNGNQVL